MVLGEAAMLEGGNKTGITVESEVSKGVVLITPIPPPTNTYRYCGVVVRTVGTEVGWSK